MRIVLLGLFLLLPSASDEPGRDDRFASEPVRPKAPAPIRFGHSWEEAQAEANRTGRRILAIFTGDHCGWCRILEQRTFTDAEVVSLTEPFVCVELNTGDERNARLVDEYQIDTIPRSFVLTPKGQVISKRTGYTPATEYAEWLKGGRTKPLSTDKAGLSTAPPPAVGAGELEADVILWFVDANRSIKRWGDDDWTNHLTLLRVLRNAGLRPRIEHISRDTFPSRWDQAEMAARRPELIVADQYGGLVRDLEKKNRFISVSSDRLAWSPENASCPDLAQRILFLVRGSWHEEIGRKAIEEILRQGPADTLPGPELAEGNSRAEASTVASKATVAFLAGDAAGLKSVASSGSPQLSRCTKPEDFRQGREVVVKSVELRGNRAFAFARVEMRFQGKTTIGADPVLVILRREASGWKALAVSSDIVTLRELPALCRLQFRDGTESTDPSAPRLLYPADGGSLGPDDRSFAWEVAGDGPPLAAQICQVLLDVEKGGSWPETRLKVLPGMPRSRSLLGSETAKDLTGLTTKQMSWCVWSVGTDGRSSFSDVRAFLH